jgi:hypothetical protein
VVVLLAVYYAVKIVRLSEKFDFVALRGGRAPYYIVLGLIFLELDRVFDLATGFLSSRFGYPLSSTFNDPPAAVSAIFIFLGLREMYVVYIRNSKVKKLAPSAQELWQPDGTEKAG